ncbi:hypothetical protein SDD30_05900 [Moorella naiadis]|uniref:hypothetical protein n=1 Tax=Moorella naiadis (nom. illeg.) TaxID=3093670 RepID=UPI003D9C9E41
MNQKPAVSLKIFYGVVSGTGRMIVSIIVAFIQVRLILNFFPKDLAGIWFLFLSIAFYISFFDLGISPTITREISFALGKQNLEEELRHKEIADLIATCLRIFQILAFVVFILSFVFGGLFLWQVAPSGTNKEIIMAWFLFSFGASVNLLGGAGFAALYGFGDVAVERIIRSITPLLGLSLSAISLNVGLGIKGLAIAWVVQGLVERSIGWIAFYKLHPVFKCIRGKASIAIARKIAIPSLKWAAIGLGAILILQTDNIIIATMIGPSFIPPYEAAVKIVTTLATLSLLIVNSSTPFLSKIYASGDTHAFESLLIRNIRYGMTLMITLVAFLAIYGDEVIDLWLGPGNFVGFPVLWTLLVMLTLEVHHVIFATATMATGRIIFVWVAFIAAAFKIAISVLLVPHLGLWGTALGTTIAQMLTNNWYVPYVTLKLLNVSVKQYLISVLSPILVLLIVMMAFNIVQRHLLNSSLALGGIVLSFLISVIVSGIITIKMIMKKEERQELFQKLHGRMEYN